MISVRSTLWTLLRMLRLGGVLLQLHPKSYLRRRGWFNSFLAKRSIDRDSRPVPWWSYGVTDFVDLRLRRFIRSALTLQDLEKTFLVSFHCNVVRAVKILHVEVIVEEAHSPREDLADNKASGDQETAEVGEQAV